MATFLLEIVTPERQAFSEQVDAVYVPGESGRMGILPHHVPLFCNLIEGEIKVNSGNREYYLAIGGGFMQVTKDKVTILVSKALHADEINEAEIEAARKSAKEVLANQKEGKEFEEAQAILRRSLIEFKVLRRRRNQPSARQSS